MSSSKLAEFVRTVIAPSLPGAPGATAKGSPKSAPASVGGNGHTEQGGSGKSGLAANKRVLKKIIIKPATSSFIVGDSLQYEAWGVYTAKPVKEEISTSVEWSSNNSSVAEVYQKATRINKGHAVRAGFVRALAAGTATITATDPTTKIPGALKIKVALKTPDAIRAAIAAGGINIAIYQIGDREKKKGDAEFEGQAKQWAKNHGAFGLAGGKVKKDDAMSLSEDPGTLIDKLVEEVKKELGTAEKIPIANVALFCHGGKSELKVDSQGTGGKETWATAKNKVIQDFAAAVKRSVTPGTKFHLYACDTAMDLEAPEAAKAKKAKKPYVEKGQDDPTRKDDFAEQLQQMTGAEVWGHEDARHTTGNPQLVQVTDTNKDKNAERYQLRDELAKKYLKCVDPTLTEDEMTHLDKAEVKKISDWIQASLNSSKYGIGNPKTDPYQVFIEEISIMGYDKLFDLLMPEKAPDENILNSLFPGHDQIEKLEKGAALVHADFHKEITKMKGTAEAAIKAARAAKAAKAKKP